MKQITPVISEPVQNKNTAILPKAQNALLDDRSTDDPDYIGPNGLLHCGSCHTPKETYNEKWQELSGCSTLPIMCRCQAEEHEKRKVLAKHREHEMRVSRLRSLCFPAKAMYDWTFENSVIFSEELAYVKKYANNWREAFRSNTGLLLWGSLGTGKTYAAACVANALLEQEISVRMTSFPKIANDLFGTEEKSEYLTDLCNVSLLIIDDFGAERKSDYMLEIMWQVLELRASIRKPLIVTTNLTLKELRDPPNEDISRIYSRILALCAPLNICLTNLREEQAEQQLGNLKNLMN